MKLNSEVRVHIRRLQKGLCCYCERPMLVGKWVGGGTIPPEAETVEHLKRKAEGGTNDKDNIALSCKECNSGRGLMDWLTYKSYRMGEFYA